MVINWKTNHIFVITEVTCFIILYTFQFVETCLDIFNSVCCYLLSVFSIFPSKIYSLKCVGFASLAAEYTHYHALTVTFEVNLQHFHDLFVSSLLNQCLDRAAFEKLNHTSQYVCCARHYKLKWSLVNPQLSLQIYL